MRPRRDDRDFFCARLSARCGSLEPRLLSSTRRARAACRPRPATPRAAVPVVSQLGELLRPTTMDFGTIIATIRDGGFTRLYLAPFLCAPAPQCRIRFRRSRRARPSRAGSRCSRAATKTKKSSPCCNDLIAATRLRHLGAPCATEAAVLPFRAPAARPASYLDVVRPGRPAAVGLVASCHSASCADELVGHCAPLRAAR